MNNIDKCNSYPFPQPGIRDEYRADIVKNKDAWTQVDVSVKHCIDMENKDAESSWVEVGKYHRNYSMMGTFEPFRQLRDGVWKDYALISTKYTRLEVMDLANGEIIAVEPMPKVDKELAEKYPDTFTEGDDLPHAMFCPVDFYVPSWWDEYEARDQRQHPAAPGISTEIAEKVAAEFLEEWKLYEGNWGVYSGCVWGDDTSWKLRFVDLSRISEGIVTTDERFGYVSLPEYKKLMDVVRVMPEQGTVEIKVPVQFSVATGKAQHKKWTVDTFNWDEG